MEEPTNGVLLANPFRYRGYYYDTSIGLYYLNSRYYDPETGRFLNEDLVSYLEPETIGGINPYAYCLNDPVNNIDPSGHLVILALILAATTAIGMTVGGVVAHEQGKTGWSLIGSILLGGALGFAAGGLAIAATGAVFGAIHGMNAFLWGMKASESVAIPRKLPENGQKTHKNACFLPFFDFFSPITPQS